MRYKETYPDTYARFREQAEKVYPGKLVLNQREAAAVLGVTPRTIARHDLHKDITLEQLARAFA